MHFKIPVFLIFVALASCGGSHSGTYLGTTTEDSTTTLTASSSSGSTSTSRTREKDTLRFENRGVGGLSMDLGNCWVPLGGTLNEYTLSDTFKCAGSYNDSSVGSGSSSSSGGTDYEVSVTSVTATFDGEKVKVRTKYKLTLSTSGSSSFGEEVAYTATFDGERASKD